MVVRQSRWKGGRWYAWRRGAGEGEFEEVTIAVLLLNSVKERFCAGIVEVQFLRTLILMVCTYIGSESDEVEVPHWITSVHRIYVGSTQGGKSICLACRSCRAWSGFAAVVDTAKMTRFGG
jgi:hypothetical protein